MFFILFVLAHKMLAGWIVVESTKEYGQMETYKSTLFIQKNMIKSVEQDRIIIFDLDQWKLTLISQENKGYWIGTPAEYQELIKKYTLDYLEKEIINADEEEKLFLQALYEDMKLEIKLDSDAITFIGELPVEIVMTDKSERLLGYRVNQFFVYSDGIQVEEVWLTREISLSDEYDFGKFRAFIDDMSLVNFFQDYRSSEKYVHLMKSGLPIRTIRESDNGSISVTDVISAEKITIPGSEFHPPPQYKPVSLQELGFVFN